VLKLRRGTVVAIEDGMLAVEVDGERRRAWADESMVGPAEVGDDVVVNTAALDLGLRRLERCHRRLLVSRLDRFLDLLDRAAHTAAARSIRGRAALGLAGALLGRLVISHLVLVPWKGALIRGP